MPRLNFKTQFLDAIRLGRKTTTLRRWKTCGLSAGDRVYSRGLGWLRIGACEAVSLSRLSGADAEADGFASLAALSAMLKRIYPNQKGDGKRWYRVSFVVEGEGEEPGRRGAKKRSAGGAKKSVGKLGGKARARLARRIRVELDKAVRRSGSLAPI
jgi:uncharacterized protein YqfB (UPF0267 family)